MRLCMIIVITCMLMPAYAAGAGKKPKSPSVEPTHDGIAYGEHKDQLLDLWLAKNDEPTALVIYIHGGGFRSGDRKGKVPVIMLRKCLDAGISFASLDYRLSGVAPYPAQMHDCARALQFLRLHAEKYNLDPKRFAATGGSAGAGISLWLAWHDDLAQPNSEDPVLRQSSRVRCALPYNAQCSYDPRFIKKIMPDSKAYKHGALIKLHGLPKGFNWDEEIISDELDKKLKDCSPITHLSKGDPPVWMLHYKRDVKDNIHGAEFGRCMVPLMKKAGVPFVHGIASDYDDFEVLADEMFAFLVEHLK